MHSAGSSTGRLISFPGRPVLSRQDAVRYLGVSGTTFWALRTLRCAPAARMLDGRLVYRTEELEQLKTSLMRTVGVGYSNSPYQPLSGQPPTLCTQHHRQRMTDLRLIP